MPKGAAAYYQWHEDLEFVSTGVLDDLLTRLSESDAVKDVLSKAGVSMAEFKQFQSKLIVYWQAHAPELVKVFRWAAARFPCMSEREQDLQRITCQVLKPRIKATWSTLLGPNRVHAYAVACTKNTQDATDQNHL